MDVYVYASFVMLLCKKNKIRRKNKMKNIYIEL